MSEDNSERPTLPPIREMFPDFDLLMSSRTSSPTISSRRLSATSASSSLSDVYASSIEDEARAPWSSRTCSAQSDRSCSSSPTPSTSASAPVFSVMAMSAAGLNTVQSAPATPLSRSSLRLLTDRAPSRMHMHTSSTSPYHLSALQHHQPNVGPVVSQGSNKRYHCPRCARGFSTQSNVWRHRRAAHPEEEIPLRSMRGRSHV
ncbi:hypothetical protein EXIGLDRAFT_722867 [Exidia glandulosa HHB12029]|uniref:C2H2-type domain-containing protein n=1 Tax=Exidia glandulosa HHB12029 TaxID=1314781 RepID=A0A165F2S1_EXIGL|nr:hypothetical protein EXIGLDRAFT_722867 [Exidia glandulosa HHB12029]